MKKIVALLCALCVIGFNAFAMGSGDSGQTAEQDGKTTVTFWSWLPTVIDWDPIYAAFKAEYPDIDIEFKASEGGSSGGLMIALNVYNAIGDVDITYGHKIAGTGTIDLLGNVGEIDGVKYKIIGAYKNNMELVFVP